MADEERERPPIYASYRGIGPAYSMKPLTGTKEHCITRQKAPAYSIGIKTLEKENQNPGPGYFYESSLTVKGKMEKAPISIKSRMPIKEIEKTPGPGDYNSHNRKHGTISNEFNAPKFSLGDRSWYREKNWAPPSTKYTISSSLGRGNVTTRGAPQWSLKPNYEFGGSHYAGKKANNPGPGTYGSVEPNIFKRNTGIFSIQGRTKQKEYNTSLTNPGPGSYNLNPSIKGGKGPSMGVRHSNYTVMCLTDIDVL